MGFEGLSPGIEGGGKINCEAIKGWKCWNSVRSRSREVGGPEESWQDHGASGVLKFNFGEMEPRQ